MNVIIENRNSLEIHAYLYENAMAFVPPLIPRINLPEYADKLALNAIQFWIFNEQEAVGFAACYFNNPDGEFGFISSISITEKAQGSGLGSSLLNAIFTFGRQRAYKQIRLEVFQENTTAIDFYLKRGFTLFNQTENKLTLSYNLV
jgi:ribosomal protein S18 acetylase RimI-like enzyme